MHTPEKVLNTQSEWVFVRTQVHFLHAVMKLWFANKSSFTSYTILTPHNTL